MKVIILDAGVGTRLDNSPRHAPKSLTLLNQQDSILACQLRALTAYVSIHHIWVVVGYEKEAIMSVFPDLGYIFNPDYQKENTAKSLLRALRKVDEDVLWLNGDVLFRPEILFSFLKANQTAMIVNRTRVGAEEVKYRTNDQGDLIEVSKELQHPEGEALGINFFKASDVVWLRQELEQCEAHDFFEKGIEKGIQKGKKVGTFVVEIDDCVEVDFPEDLIRAKTLVKRWKLV